MGALGLPNQQMPSLPNFGNPSFGA